MISQVKYPNQPEKSGNCPAGGCKAIVDTGTYLVYGPETQVSNMLTSQLQSCSKHGDMPSFTFDFQVKPNDPPVSLTINPIDYILKVCIYTVVRTDYGDRLMFRTDSCSLYGYSSTSRTATSALWVSLRTRT